MEDGRLKVTGWVGFVCLFVCFFFSGECFFARV